MVARAEALGLYAVAGLFDIARDYEIRLPDFEEDPEE